MQSMIHRHWPTDLMSARNWSSTIHTKITEKMRSEPAIVCENMSPAGECDSPKKTSTLQGTNISPKNGILKMIFLFPRWDMLIPWRVSCWMFFYKKKGWRLFFGIFALTFSPNQQKMDKFSVDSCLGWILMVIMKGHWCNHDVNLG